MRVLFLSTIFIPKIFPSDKSSVSYAHDAIRNVRIT